eukprot:scaffold248255_cov27-Tisochrysis_lutea.AAC.1
MYLARQVLEAVATVGRTRSSAPRRTCGERKWLLKESTSTVESLATTARNKGRRRLRTGWSPGPSHN